MENREEITKKYKLDSIIGVETAMQEYSDQQNKALLDEIEQFKKLVLLKNNLIEINKNRHNLFTEMLDSELKLNKYLNLKISLLEVQLKSSKQDVEILKSELKAADSVNDGLSNLIKDVYDKTDNVKIFLLIEERLESNDLMNIILPNQPK